MTAGYASVGQIRCRKTESKDRFRIIPHMHRSKGTPFSSDLGGELISPAMECLPTITRRDLYADGDFLVTYLYMQKFWPGLSADARIILPGQSGKKAVTVFARKANGYHKR
jgi:hypothetical protein